MKRLFNLAACIMAIAMVGCTQDVEIIVPHPPVADAAMAINIRGSISQEYATRVSDDGFCDGDR